MVTETKRTSEPRVPLTKDRVFKAAIKIADEETLDALTMRHLAEELGVEAMSLYYHVANKEAVLDGIIDAIMGEIAEALGGFEVPKDEAKAEWKKTLRNRILTARTVMLRHPWAPAVFETRTNMSPVLIMYFEGLLGILREGGFTYDLAHHAMHALGSRALGFSQELFQPEDEAGDEENDAMLEEMAAQLPYLVGMMMEISHDDPDSTLGWCDDESEFKFALDLILDGLETHRTTA